MNRAYTAYTENVILPLMMTYWLPYVDGDDYLSAAMVVMIMLMVMMT